MNTTLINKLSKTDFNKLSAEELAEKIKTLRAVVSESKLADQFYYWKPNDGEITPERREILKRWLKEEDIPDRTDSQLDVLLCDKSIKGVSGGNRSSKTDVGTVDGVIKSTGELPKSLEPYHDDFEAVIERAHKSFVSGRVTGVDNKQLHRVVIPMWQKYVPTSYLKDGSWEKSYSKEFDILTLYRNKKPCSSVEFLTNEQKVKSAQGNVLHWAKFDEEPEQAKYKETLMRFGTSDRLDIEIDWTPTEGLTWATDLFHSDVFEDQEDTHDKALFKLTPVTNPYVNTKTLIKIMDEFSKVSSYEEMKMRLLGEAISLTGLVYSGLFTRSVHVIPPFKIDYKKYLVLRGLDPHLVKPTVCVEVAVDRMLHEYVIGTYYNDADTEIVKKELAERAWINHYRLGWTRCDKSANSTIKALGDRNIFLELGRGKNFIPALDMSEKATGSIHAGVDTIKKLLKINPITKKPRLFIFDIPENQLLIKAFMTLEREAYTNEDKKGMKDRINEGKHDAHAALRYIHQRHIRWLPPVQEEYIPQDEESYV